MTEGNEPNGKKTKLQILGIIREIIHRNQWNQTAAAKILGVDQPKVSQIINGRASGFSLERLLVFLLRLHCKIEISIHVKRSGLKTIDSGKSVNGLDAVNLTVLSRDF